MKNLILLLSLIACSSMMFAQAIELVSVPDTVYYNPNNPDGYFDVKGKVKNPSSNMVTVKLARVDNQLASGHETNFCWGEQCYPAEVDVAPFDVSIGSGVTDTTFKLTLTHFGIGGSTSATMRFVNAADANDTIRHTIVFMEDPTASIGNELEGFGYTMELAGNPVTDFANLNITLPTRATASVSLLDLNGRVLTTQTVNFSGSTQINMADLPAGIYMARLETEGRSLKAIRVMKQ